MIFERECKTCDVAKPVGDFHQYAPGKHRHTCKACMAADQRKYQKRYDEKKRLKKIIEAAPSVQAQIDAINIRLDAMLAILSSHGYNTTET